MNFPNSLIVYSLTAFSLSAQVAQLRWDVQQDRPVAHDVQVWQGETVDLMPRLVQGTLPVAVTNAPVEFRYRESSLATNTYRYVVTSSDTNSGVLSVRWIPDYDAGAAWYDYQFIVGSNAANPRAFGRITMRPTIGWPASANPPPPVTLYPSRADLQAVSNALAEAVQAESQARASTNALFNAWFATLFNAAPNWSTAYGWGDWHSAVSSNSASLQILDSNLSSHTNRTDNPHAVTPEQIGALPLSSMPLHIPTKWRESSELIVNFCYYDAVPQNGTIRSWFSYPPGRDTGESNVMLKTYILPEQPDVDNWNAKATAQSVTAVASNLVYATNVIVQTYLLSGNAWLIADFSNQTVTVSMIQTNGTTNTVSIGSGNSNAIDPSATNLLWMALNAGLAGKAPKAWGQYAPDGSANPEPDYMTFLNAPATVFASGAQWSTYGTYAVLTATGTVAFASGGDGQFRLGPNSTNWFGFVQGGSVTVGAVAESLAVAAGGTAEGIATIVYPYSGGDFPALWFSPSLGTVDFATVEGVVWVDNQNGTATVTAPATTAKGFWYATTTATFGNVFESTMPARFSGGVFGDTNALPVIFDSVIEISSGGHTYRLPAQLAD